MSTTTTCDWNDAVAKVMAESGASKEAAEEALHERGGNVDGAILLLLNETFKSPTKPPPPRMDSGPTFIDDAPSVAAFNDDDAVAKSREPPMYASSLRTPSATVTEKATDDITENEDDQENQHHDDTVSGEGAASIESPPSSGNNIITSNDTNTSSIRVRAQMPPRQTQPGAVRVAGFDPENQNDSTFSVTTTTVENGRGNADSEDLISAQLVGDIPEAEIVEEKQQCSTRVKIWSAVAVVLAMTVAVVLGTVLTRAREEMQPTEAPKPSPQEVIQELEGLLSSVSLDNGRALRTASSPQNNALNWLANNNTNLEEYTDDQKIQRYALATLFFSTSGTRWNQNKNWMSNEVECGWYNNAGALCTSGSVDTLDLWNNNLVGTIPNELALMSNLSRLDLSSNSLTGTMPTEIALMSNLSELYLFDNRLRGMIPSQIALMSNLYTLDLDSNSLTGTIPSQIALMSNLAGLYLSYNILTGTIPSQIAMMSNLTYLDLSSNILMGTITKEIALMSNLYALYLYNNSLTGTIPSEIGLLSNLATLWLHNNNFTGEFTCPAFTDECYISCDDYHNDTCRSL